MARLTNALLGQQAFGNGSTQPMLDITYGGQMGWAPDLTQWISNQAYIRKNLICILLEAPRFFGSMPNQNVWVQALKSLVELRALTIEGMNATIEVEVADHPVGGAGEIQQEIVNSTRTRSDPTFTFVESYGLPIQTFLSMWIQYGMMDPDTKYALVGTLATNAPTDLLADWYTMSCLFIEPDPTASYVVKSWVTTNMMPKTTGEIIGKRDLNSASEVLNISVNFTALSQFNLGSNVFAQQILDGINKVNANPYLRPSFIQAISSDVAGATAEGYAQGVTNLGNEALKGAGN